MFFLVDVTKLDNIIAYIIVMENKIKNIDGEDIIVTDIVKAIEEAETYIYFSEASKNENLLGYWQHNLAELKKLQPRFNTTKKIVDKPTDSPIDRCKNIYGDFKGKGFIKSDTPSPLYGLYSCAKKDSYLYKIDNLNIGESFINGGGTKITRVY